MSQVYLVIALILVGADRATAQERSFAEFEAGGGYVIGGGAEDPGPSLATYNVAVVIWLLRSWGVAYRLVTGPGEDPYSPPIEGDDRLFLGEGKLRYHAYTVRYRRDTPGSTLTEIGFGFMGGRFRDFMFIKHLNRRVESEVVFDGFAIEALVGKQLSRYFRVKGGVTYDFNFETNHFQPVLLAAVGWP